MFYLNLCASVKIPMIIVNSKIFKCLFSTQLTFFLHLSKKKMKRKDMRGEANEIKKRILALVISAFK